MSKNAWSTGYRFVAVAALAVGASSAVTGTAAANDGATGHTGCPKAVAKKATGCHDSAGRKAKPAKRRSDYGRAWQNRPRQEEWLRRLDASVILRHLRRGGGLPMTDQAGFAASRGLGNPIPLRVDPRLARLPDASPSGTLAAAPSLPDARELIVNGRLAERTPRTVKETEVTAKVREVQRTVGTVTDARLGDLLRIDDQGLLAPAVTIAGPR